MSSLFQFFKIPDISTPYAGNLPGTLSNDTKIFARVKINENAQQFCINLENSNGIALHFNPRLNQSVTIVNSCLNDEWDDEVKTDSVPFEENNSYGIEINVHEDKYEIIIEGNHLVDLPHRLDFSTVKSLSINGDIEVEDIIYSGSILNISSRGLNQAEENYEPEDSSLNTAEVNNRPEPLSLNTAEENYGPEGVSLNTAEENYGPEGVSLNTAEENYAPNFNHPQDDGSRFFKVSNPEVPHSSDIPHGLVPGKRIFARVKFNDNCEELKINLKTTDGIALHFNPRLSSDCVVLNCFFDHAWGIEEKIESMPFKKNEIHAIEIMTNSDYFSIGIDGGQLCEYSHRVPYDSIKSINIEGNVEIEELIFSM